MENTQYENIVSEVRELADKYSADMLRINTLDFDFIFERGEDAQLHLVKTKAVIRALGKTTKVVIGEGEEFSTYDEAFHAVKKHWSEYYKAVRAKRTPKQIKAEAIRQKRYQANRKARLKEFTRRG